MRCSFFLIVDMVKPVKEMIFRPIDGIYRDPASGKVLADVLDEYELLIDDRMQFARIYDYERELLIYYRAGSLMVRLTFWKLDRE